MLLGQYDGVLSPSRRTAIPKKFLSEMGRMLVVAKWYEGCLVVVSKASWQALLNRLTGKSEYVTQAVRDTDRFILGSAFEMVPDEQGRMVFPENLVAYANLGQRLTFLGLGDRVEIWDKETWVKREGQVAERASRAIEEIAGKAADA